MIQPKKFTGTIVNHKKISSTVMHIEIQSEEKHKFKAGQFSQISFKKNDELYKKPYSISSAPWEENLHFCVKKVENGRVSTAIHELKKGDEVEILSPLGMLTLPEIEPENYVFITVGTGVAPFRSMIRQLFQKTISGMGKDTSAHTNLLFGTKTEETILYKDEFEQLQKNNSNFNYLVTLSREEKENYLSGHVQKHLDKLKITENTKVYLCGLTVMVKDIKEHLLNKGISKNLIHEEHYG